MNAQTSNQSDNLDDFWNDGAVLPHETGKYPVKFADGTESTRMFVLGVGWQGVGLVDNWKWADLPVEFEDVADLVVFNGDDFQLIGKSELEAMSDTMELEAIMAVIQTPDAVMDIGVKVNRYFTVADGASTSTAGRVLAVGVTYAAQHVGGGDVVIHENARLSKPLHPGDGVTIAYRDGDGVVLPGVFQKYEVSIEIPSLPPATVDKVNEMVVAEIVAARVNMDDSAQVLAAVERCVEFITGGKAENANLVYTDRLTREHATEPPCYGLRVVDADRAAGASYRAA